MRVRFPYGLQILSSLRNKQIIKENMVKYMKQNKFIFLFLLLIQTSYSQTWHWAQNSIGGGLNEGFDTSVDFNGNVYVTGSFDTTSVSFGTYTLTNSKTTGGTNANVFLVKYDPNGNVLWAKSAGGSNYCWANSVCNDPQGNVIITGICAAPTLTLDSYTISGGAFFIAKYDSNGNILWAKRSSGNGSYSPGNSVECDLNGSIFVTGQFSSDTIKFGSVTLSTTSITSKMFLVKYNFNGNALWGRMAQGTSGSSGVGGNSISTDSNGNVYVGGTMNGYSALFDTINTSIGSYDPFLAKYDSLGNIQWVKRGIGYSQDVGNGISTDPSGNTYLTGYFFSPTMSFGTYTISNVGNRNIFLVKYNTNGTPLWAKSIGGSYVDVGYSVATHSTGVYLSGKISSNSITIGTSTINSPGTNDAMLMAKFDPNGNLICYSTLEGGGDDQNGLAVNQSGDVFIGSDFFANPLVIGTNTLTLTGVESVFVAKFSCLGVGIKELVEDTNITTYPIPTNNSIIFSINFELNSARLTISNMLGEIVLSQNVSMGLNEISLAKLSNGIYNYSVSFKGENLKMGKLIKQ